MVYSEEELKLLKTVTDFLRTTFKGSCVNGLKIDDAVTILDKVITDVEAISDSSLVPAIEGADNEQL